MIHKVTGAVPKDPFPSKNPTCSQMLCILIDLKNVNKTAEAGNRKVPQIYCILMLALKTNHENGSDEKLAPSHHLNSKPFQDSKRSVESTYCHTQVWNK